MRGHDEEDDYRHAGSQRGGYHGEDPGRDPCAAV